MLRSSEHDFSNSSPGLDANERLAKIKVPYNFNSVLYCLLVPCRLSRGVNCHFYIAFKIIG